MMADYNELVDGMLASQNEILEAIVARVGARHGDLAMGEKYSALVLRTAETFSVLKALASQDEHLQGYLIEAGGAVLVCGVFRLRTELLSGQVTVEQEQEFLDYVAALSAKQVKIVDVGDDE